jgi:hypothetical protein
MKNSVISLKNYISVFKSRLLNKESISESEQISFFECLEETLTSIENEFDNYDKRLASLETKKVIPRNQSADDFVSSTLNKIELLKNIIKSKMGNPDEELFSFNLTSVESIEQEINDTHTVTRTNLEKLNKIYLSERNQS